MMWLMICPFPSLLAPKAYWAREKVAVAFQEYFLTAGIDRASPVAKYLYESQRKHGVSTADMGRIALGTALGSLLSTIPATFWVLLMIYTHTTDHAPLLDEIRAEVDAITVVSKADHHGGRKVTCRIDLIDVAHHCPLLVSTIQETIRWRSVNQSLRMVTEDTVLADRWLLRKGAFVQMPAHVLHRNRSIWGADADQFRPRRFMADDSSHVRVPGRFLRSFGGGNVLCPGRHFGETFSFPLCGHADH